MFASMRKLTLLVILLLVSAAAQGYGGRLKAESVLTQMVGADGQTEVMESIQIYYEQMEEDATGSRRPVSKLQFHLPPESENPNTQILSVSLNDAGALVNYANFTEVCQDTGDGGRVCNRKPGNSQYYGMLIGDIARLGVGQRKVLISYIPSPKSKLRFIINNTKTGEYDIVERLFEDGAFSTVGLIYNGVDISDRTIGQKTDNTEIIYPKTNAENRVLDIGINDAVCGDGVCEIEKESCISCPDDCPCPKYTSSKEEFSGCRVSFINKPSIQVGTLNFEGHSIHSSGISIVTEFIPGHPELKPGDLRAHLAVDEEESLIVDVGGTLRIDDDLSIHVDSIDYTEGEISINLISSSCPVGWPCEGGVCKNPSITAITTSTSCTKNSDCYDGFACTDDICSAGKCLYDKTEGCEHDGWYCLPLGSPKAILQAIPGTTENEEILATCTSRGWETETGVLPQLPVPEMEVADEKCNLTITSTATSMHPSFTFGSYVITFNTAKINTAEDQSPPPSFVGVGTPIKGSFVAILGGGPPNNIIRNYKFTLGSAAGFGRTGLKLGSMSQTPDGLEAVFFVDICPDGYSCVDGNCRPLPTPVKSVSEQSLPVPSLVGSSEALNVPPLSSEETAPIVEIIEANIPTPAECYKTDDCDDGLACTIDLCSGGTCSHTKMTGCQLEGECIPLGTRAIVDSTESYCSPPNVWKKQVEDGSNCQNSYECRSNACLDGKCGELSTQLKGITDSLNYIISLLTKFFGR